MYRFVMIVFVFCMGSLLGWVIEVLYRHLADKEKRWFNPGFCVGPYLPIYGIGLLVAYLISYIEIYIPIENLILKRIVLFTIMATCMTLIELFGGMILLKYFDLRLWDYSDEKFNYKGYICLKFSFFWIIISAVYYFLIHPEVQGSIEWLSQNLIFSFLVGIIIGVYVIDIIYSAHVVGRIKQLVEDKGIVIKLEEIKERFSREKKREEAKAAFFVFMLKDNIESLIHLVKREEK